MESHLQGLTTYFSLHPEVALAAVFAAAFLEALAVVGTVVPGSSIVFMAGALIGLGSIGLWPAFGAAVLGAIIGDGISYWLGRRYHDRLRSCWPFGTRPQLLERGQLYFSRHGRMSVFWGRFLSPIRAIVPVVAGMTNMPATSFYLMNILSALAWAALHLIPGMFFGASVGLAGAVSSRLGLVVMVISLSLWGVAWLASRLYRALRPVIARQRDRLVKWAKSRSGVAAGVIVSLLDPTRPEAPGLLIAAALLLGGTWLFLGTMEDVVAGDPLVLLDQAVFSTLQGLRTSWLDGVMIAITELGGARVALPVTAAAALVFAMGRCWRTLAYWLAAVGFERALVWTLKIAVGRTRPTAIYTGIEQLSFPSGHAASSIVLYGFLAYLLARGKSHTSRRLIALVASSTILFISFSRLYLGAHWFSDVLASLAFGTAWVALLSIAYTRHVPDKPFSTPWLSAATVATFVIVGALVVTAQHATDSRRYAVRRVEALAPLPAWQGGDWSRLPAFRKELEGDKEDFMSVQWAGTAGAVDRALLAAGWHVAEPWTAKNALSWLSPQSDVSLLPVLPKLNQGNAPAMTYVLPLGPRQRLVIRLWRSGYATSPLSGQQPVWMGTVTREQSRRLANLITVVETNPDTGTPVQSLARTLEADPTPVRSKWVERSSGAKLLLVQ